MEIIKGDAMIAVIAVTGIIVPKIPLENTLLNSMITAPIKGE